MAFLQVQQADHRRHPGALQRSDHRAAADQCALLVLGTFMDMAPMIIICTPVLLPIVKAFGIDPVHFGVVMILNAGIGLNTPPVGTVLFVGCAVGEISDPRGDAHHLAVLRRQHGGADAGDLRAGALALAAGAVPLKQRC